MADLGTDAPLDAGAGAFPPGPMPNYDNPETLAPATVAVALTFTILATLTTALRVWGTSQNSMIQRRLKIGWEEFLIIIALGLSWFSTAIMIINTKYGSGRHPIDIPPEWWIPDLQIFPSRLVYAIITHLVALAIVKCSLLVFFCRIIPSRTFFWACIGTGFFVIATAIVSLFTTLFACDPIKAWWDYSIPRSACIDYVTCLVWMGGINAFSDIVIVALPLPVILKSFMSSRKKIQVISMFSLGLIVSVAAWIRVGYLVKGSRDPTDLMWEGAIQQICCAIELNIALICANLPQCKHYLAVRFPKYFGDMGATRNDSNGVSGGSGQSGNSKSKKSKASAAQHSDLESKDYNTYVMTASSTQSINAPDRETKDWA